MLGVLSNIQSSVGQIALLEGWSLKQQQRRRRRPCSPRASRDAKAHLTLSLYSLLLFSNHLEPLSMKWRSLFFSHGIFVLTPPLHVPFSFNYMWVSSAASMTTSFSCRARHRDVSAAPPLPCFFFFFFLFLPRNTFTPRQKGSWKGRNFKMAFSMSLKNKCLQRHYSEIIFCEGGFFFFPFF